MRIAFAAVLLSLSLVASPAFAEASAGRPAPMGFFTSIPRNFVTGAQFYFETVGSWFAGLLELLGLTEKLRIVAEGAPCAQNSRCAIGLVCLNVCADAACDTYDRRCQSGPERVDVLGEYSICGRGNLCADGTVCTRTCPQGADCGDESHRCMRPSVPTGRCTAAADCRAICDALPFPPIGPSAWRARCVSGACACDPVEIRPSDPRVECPGSVTEAMSCPAGAFQACTPSDCPAGGCPPYLTCLTSPSYGGTCFGDAECADAACSEGASPFCDAAERRCKCRSTEIRTISCAAAADCSVAGCAANEIAACLEGACACAPAGVTTACTTATDCSADCPEGFARACVDGGCVCQRTTENVPVACASVDDCGGVSCPAGYDKACLEAKCSCTRTVPQ